MRILGLDPSLTNFGYVVYEDGILLDKGRLQTSPQDGLQVQRFLMQANGLGDLVRKWEIKYVSCEAPLMATFSTEILYGLQSFLHLIYWKYGLHVVFFIRSQIQTYACPHMSLRDILKRDMVDSARKDLGMRDNERLANDVADAYWIGKMGFRWWCYYTKIITDVDLTEKEKHMFAGCHTYTRGKKKGVQERTGIVYRENELYYLYDKLPRPTVTF